MVNNGQKNDLYEAESQKDVKAIDPVIKIAKQYQEKMEKIPIPSAHDQAPIPFTTWQELENSMSQIYGQPLHYATHRILEDWESLRVSDSISPPKNVVAVIWGIEDIHRRCISHLELAMLWLSDPTYHAIVDPIIKCDNVESYHA
ncbi:hypothetical protein Ddye_011521 [Dipteronia dyeriana]|uniref:Uncharacterized protein n=1 Tax=Dipteronia dyeriana TaxID=168575 RepID=A0AAD9X2P8_9ROSI|nr:hypothetical protein Ddye_011521 [Dipteronia dyeriana]